jgi:predicted DsbA family dithiol-disulfide isomerase
MTTASPLPIDVISDVVCPWCYIGKRRLEQAIALKPAIPVEVHFRPYFLNPWVPREGISREQYLVTKFGSVERYNANNQRVVDAAAAAGLTMRDKICASQYARLPPADPVGGRARQRRAHEAAADGALFQRRRRLTDREVLVKAAADCELDPPRAQTARQRPDVEVVTAEANPPRRPASTAFLLILAAHRGQRRAGARTSGAGDRAGGGRVRPARGRRIAALQRTNVGASIRIALAAIPDPTIRTARRCQGCVR